jgi:hypothetical protein
MKKRRPIASLEELKVLFAEFEKSKMSLRDFSDKKGLAYSTVCNYRGRMIKAGLINPETSRLFTEKHRRLIKQKKSTLIPKNLLPKTPTTPKKKRTNNSPKTSKKPLSPFLRISTQDFTSPQTLLHLNIGQLNLQFPQNINQNALSSILEVLKQHA